METNYHYCGHKAYLGPSTRTSHCMKAGPKVKIGDRVIANSLEGIVVQDRWGIRAKNENGTGLALKHASHIRRAE